MKLELIRTYYPNGTNGELLLNGDRLSSTIELPWKNNEPKVSCIPEGEYELKKRYSKKFGEHFILVNVPERSYILLHPANDALKELKGCIAPVSFLTGEGKGSQSRTALQKLSEAINPELTKGNKILLIIQSKKHD
jgi:hypothetical protein